MDLVEFANRVLDPLRGHPEIKRDYPLDIQPKDPDYITIEIQVQDGTKFTLTFRELDDPTVP